jgi:hypothetical protein
MQKRDEEGPHLAEAYRIKMCLRCLPSPRVPVGNPTQLVKQRESVDALA